MSCGRSMDSASAPNRNWNPFCDAINLAIVCAIVFVERSGDSKSAT